MGVDGNLRDSAVSQSRWSSRSSRSASRTVYRLTENLWQSSSSVGSCDPTGWTPFTISSFNARTTWRYRGSSDLFGSSDLLTTESRARFACFRTTALRAFGLLHGAAIDGLCRKADCEDRKIDSRKDHRRRTGIWSAIIFQASNRHRFAARQVRFLPLTRPTASVIVIDWHASMTGRGYSETS